MTKSNSREIGKKASLLIILLLILAALTALMLFLKSHNFESVGADVNDSGIEILKFNTEDVGSFTYTLQGESYTISRDGEYWKSDEENSLKLDTKAVNAMLSSCSDLKATAKISDDMSDAAEYGLDDAKFSLKIVYKDGSADTLKVGAENPMTAVNYVAVEPDGGIYTVEFSPETEFKNPSELQTVKE